ncbi:MAG: SufD family Fe-S cluster assembly protein [Flavobacteriales bacterium]|nr:SufD family Fe-S cluster assembly protein [Flavobacteriales bacterium]
MCISWTATGTATTTATSASTCPDCTSDELYKGIVARKATGVFNGKVFVKLRTPNAPAPTKRTRTSCKAMMPACSRKPSWRSRRRRVKCHRSHGCTIGRMVEQAIFYLRSRGVSEAREARRMMSHASHDQRAGPDHVNPDWRKQVEE